MKVFGYILLTLAVFSLAMITIVASGLNLALVCSVWDQPPQGWHIRLFGWNGLLLLNLLCTFVVSSILFFTVIWLPRRLDQHVDANRSGGTNPQ